MKKEIVYLAVLGVFLSTPVLANGNVRGIQEHAGQNNQEEEICEFSPKESSGVPVSPAKEVSVESRSGVVSDSTQTFQSQVADGK